MDFANYTVHDFVADKDFRNWVINSDREAELFWSQWMTNNPSKVKTLLQARELLINLAFDTYDLPEDEVLQVWEQIDKRISDSEKDTFDAKTHRFLIPTDVPSHVNTSRFRNLGTAASVSAFIAVFSALIYLLFSSSLKSIEEISTDFGELKTITLSDGSIVKLNANSILKFNQDWQKGEEREIWLEGEAYFNVIHTKQNTPFKVYANGMEVRVLGTEFNVYGRENMAKVVLEEGAIKLKTSSSQQSLRLEPGDMVTFNTKNLDLRKDRVDTRLHTSWKDRKLVFSKTSLMKLSDIMKENFDLDFFFIDANLAKKEFTGVIPSDNKDILIQSLSEAFNIDVEVRGKTVILRSKSDEKSKYQ